jgi:hypothetical protein
MKAADGAGLLDVEHLARGRLHSGVDDENMTDTIVCRQCPGARAANISCAKDRNSRHEPVGYSTGHGDTHGQDRHCHRRIAWYRSGDRACAHHE